MILISYLVRRFGAYFLTFTFLLGLLVNFVEFVEKVVRTPNASFLEIGYFIAINFIVSLFDLMPQASWLAMFFLLRELSMQHEWDVLSLVGLRPRTFMAYVFIMGLGIAGSALLIKELWVTPLASHAEQYKRETFKQQVVGKIIDRWVMLDDTTFVHVGSVDLSSGCGTDIQLVYLKQDFSLEKVITASTFNVDKGRTLHVSHAYVYEHAKHQAQQLSSLAIEGNSFISQLQAQVCVPTLKNLTTCLWASGVYMPYSVRNELLYTLLKRVFEYVQLVLYPLLTVGLFIVCIQQLQWSWAILFSPYLLMTLLSVCGDFFVLSWGLSAWILMFLYSLILFLFVLALRLRI